MSGHDDRLVRRAMRAAAGRERPGRCPDAELLGLYAERELGGDERPAVETHVAGCARCQAVVAAFVRSAPDCTVGGRRASTAVRRGRGGRVGAGWCR